MFCENCGKNLPEGTQFRNGCGAKTAPAQAFICRRRPRLGPKAPTRRRTFFHILSFALYSHCVCQYKSKRDN